MIKQIDETTMAIYNNDLSLGPLNIQLPSTEMGNILSIIISIFFTLIYFAIVAFVIVFIVKSVKYFKRQEIVLKEINEKLGKIESGIEKEKSVT